MTRNAQLKESKESETKQEGEKSSSKFKHRRKSLEVGAQSSTEPKRRQNKRNRPWKTKAFVALIELK